MPFLKNISRYILLLILCALTVFSCDRQHDDLAFTNPIDPDNPETHGDPYNLRVDAKEDSITVQWDKDQLTDVDGFVVYRSTSPDGGFQQIGVSTSHEYDDTDAPPGVTYYYQVSAYRGTEDRQTVPSHLTERSHGMIKAPPVVRITSRYEEWESGTLTVAAEASDVDGSIQQVRFEYSLNGQTWDEIFTDTEPPYSVEWDTTSVIETLDGSVWVKAIATDSDGLTGENVVDTAFGVDNEPPAFLEWHRDPDDLTEDTKGKFRIQVKVTDGDGSGLVGSVSQMDYHIGESTSYDGYADMAMEGSDAWYYEILEPQQGWDYYSDQNIYYRIRLEDAAGNETVSGEQRELIDDVNDPPIVSITSTFSAWESGTLTIAAEASDEDGTVASVQFQYSPNSSSWTRIGSADDTAPYSVTWNTKQPLPEIAKTVWIRAIAKDDDGDEAEDTTPNSFGIDNQPPGVSHDYDGQWHTQNFVINLSADDGDGAGVESISYILNGGQGNTVSGQASIQVWITTEGADNALEYWSVDKLGNESTHETLSNIKLDKTGPVFSDWVQDPDDLTEDTDGSFRVSVHVTGADGNGLDGKPQLDYHIGTATQYDGYEDMTGDGGDVWRFVIPEPAGKWSAHRGQYVYYKATARDDAGNTGESIQRQELIDSRINHPPKITSSAITEATEDKLYTYDVNATDPDADDVLTYSLTTKPSGMNIDPSTGVISWTPTNAQVAQHGVTVSVSDAAGEIDTQPFTIAVANVNDPPIITSTAVTTATEDVLYTYDVDATDEDAGDVLTYSLTTLPSGMSIDPSTGIITWTPTNDDVDVHSVVVTASDGNGGSNSQSFNVTVVNVNDPPKITSTPVTTAMEGILYTYDVDAVDSDVGDELTYSLTKWPSGMEIDAETGVISWAPAIAQVGSSDVVVKATDSEGLSDTQSFTITVIGVSETPMALILAGEFQMGDAFSEEDSDELPVHTVYVDAFYMDIYEVTNARYAKFLNEYGKNTDAAGNELLNFDGSDCRIEKSGDIYIPKTGYDTHPVVEVNWYGAAAYAEFYGKRLPTEAEWEKAARGGLVGKRYPWGDELTHDDANYDGTGGRDIWNGTAPVGSFPPNGYGLYDMAGNVFGWCADWYDKDYYTNSPKYNPTGPSSGISRVMRGGSWPGAPRVLRVAYRGYNAPANTFKYFGFRCARDAPNFNDPPEITSTAVTTAMENVPYTYDVNATDPDVGDVLTYSLTTRPSGMSIDSSTGIISWTPTNAQVGSSDVVVKVTDRDGLSNTQSFTITVIGVSDTQMVLIPEGEFEMGSAFMYDGDSDELPVHTVYTDAFYMDIYEVTNAQYAKFLNEYGRNTDSAGHELLDIESSYPCLIERIGDTYMPRNGYEDHPAIEVSWYGAAAYAQFYSKKLPTEAQWEKAARGGLMSKRYPQGDHISHEEANYDGIDGSDVWYGTAPVGSFPPNGYDLYDMAGNVWEWCADTYSESYYSVSPKNNPTGPDDAVTFENDDFVSYETFRVVRSGAWNTGSSAIRVASRSFWHPALTYPYIGFRCVEYAPNFNDPPEITSTPVTTATEDELYTYDVDATDPDIGDVLTYSLTTKPSGMSIDSSTGVITWTPTNAQVGSSDVVVKVTDSEGLSDTQSFTITVSAVSVSDTPMELIPAGEFQMGDAFNEEDSDELPVHTVYVDAFYMDIYEVTNAQYARFLNEYGKNSDAAGHELLDIDSIYCLIERIGSTYSPVSGYEHHPVIEVSWYGAAAYAQFYGKQLPTEAEWERAARGGLAGKRYPWGDEITHDDANYGGTGGKDIWSGTAPVGSFAPNGYGLYDVAGNVYEWCADEYDSGYYSVSPPNNPKGPGTAITFINDDFTSVSESSNRVLRGGSWSYSKDHVRAANRDGEYASDMLNRVGFRCVEDAPSFNDPPVITSTPVTTATEGEFYTYDVDATDPDVGDVLTYSLITKPSGMSINSSTGAITWTPTNTHVGSNDVVVSVSDGNGGSDTQSFSITVAASSVDDLPETKIGADGAEMALIPAGEFQMGDAFSEGEPDELPVHTVYVDAFYMDIYEVTNAQYARFLNEYGKNSDSAGNELLDIVDPDCLIEKVGSTYSPISGYEDYHVGEVSWYGAAAYAQFYGKRLPTEAEWEKAARGGLVGKRYPWGDEITHDDANYWRTGGKDIWRETAPVGSFAPNGYGLYDVAGNAWEWCADEYDSGYYSVSPPNNPKGPGMAIIFVGNDFTAVNDERVLRGGGWNTDNPSYFRVSYRDYYDPDLARDYIGFRCGVSLSD